MPIGQSKVKLLSGNQNLTPARLHAHPPAADLGITTTRFSLKTWLKCAVCKVRVALIWTRVVWQCVCRDTCINVLHTKCYTPGFEAFSSKKATMIFFNLFERIKIGIRFNSLVDSMSPYLTRAPHVGALYARWMSRSIN